MVKKEKYEITDIPFSSMWEQGSLYETKYSRVD